MCVLTSTNGRSPSGGVLYLLRSLPSSERKIGSGAQDLDLRNGTVAGFDWGARTANIMAAIWPERCSALASVSGYLIGSQQAGNANQ